MGKRQKQREDPQAARLLRSHRRKRHRMIFRVLCCLLVCVAAVFATTIFFRVSDMQVTGETRYKAEDIIGTSGVQEGDNLFFLHTKTIVQSLENTYPYLDTVQIKRHLPGTLEIAVTERKPLICVKAGDGQYYVDKQGKVLEKITGTPKSSVISVVGAGAKTLQAGQMLESTQDENKGSGKYEKIHAVLELLNLFDSYDMLDNVRSVDITKSFDVKLNYNDSYTIEFGTLDDLEYKIQFLKAILKRDDLPETGIIDLSQGDKAHYRPAETDDTATEETESTDTDAEQGVSSNTPTSDSEANAETSDSTEQTDTAEDASADTTTQDNTDEEASTDQTAE